MPKAKKNIAADSVTLRQLIEFNPGVSKFLAEKEYTVGEDLDGTEKVFSLLFNITNVGNVWILEGGKLGKGAQGEVTKSHRIGFDEPLPLGLPLTWSTKKKKSRKQLNRFELQALRRSSSQFAEAIKASSAAIVDLSVPATPESLQGEMECEPVIRTIKEAVIEEELAVVRGVPNLPKSAVNLRHKITEYGTFISTKFISRNYPGVTLDNCENLTIMQMVEVMVAVLKDLLLHQQLEIVHLDVKPANIIVNLEQQITAVLIDHGCSEFYRSDLRAFNVGTPAYRAPEQRSYFAYATYKVDVYSLGLSFLRKFYGDYSEGFVMPESVEFTSYLIDTYELPPVVAEGIAEFIYGMLVKEPENRITCDAALIKLEEIQKNCAEVLEACPFCIVATSKDELYSSSEDMESPIASRTCFFGGLAMRAALVPPTPAVLEPPRFARLLPPSDDSLTISSGKGSSSEVLSDMGSPIASRASFFGSPATCAMLVSSDDSSEEDTDSDRENMDLENSTF